VFVISQLTCMNRRRLSCVCCSLLAKGGIYPRALPCFGTHIDPPPLFNPSPTELTALLTSDTSARSLYGVVFVYVNMSSRAS
jgi:hypothetical protein